jgi:hypothetical protein
VLAKALARNVLHRGYCGGSRISMYARPRRSRTQSR